jgi:hypothetical protein
LSSPGRSPEAQLCASGGCFDNDGLFDPEALPQDYVTLRAPIAGVYQIDAGVQWESNVTGQRFLGIAAPTCCYAASWVNATSGADTIQTASDLVKLGAGEHVYAVVIQSAGASVKLVDSRGTFLAMHWVSP